MAEPIEIIIRQGGTGGNGLTGGADNSGTGAGATRARKGAKLSGILGTVQNFLPEGSILNNLNAADVMIINAIQSSIKQGINTGLAQYGNLTGDYIGQRQIKIAMQLQSDMSGIAVGAIAGAAKGGAVGAIIGAAISLLSLDTKIIMNGVSTAIDIRKQNIQAEFMRERAGSTLGSGSRGTYE